MGRGRLLGGCAWLLGGLALLQTLYLRALPPPRDPPPQPRTPPRPLPRGVLDASGGFRIYRDLLGTPPRWASDPRPELVLATHGSPGRAAAAILGGGSSWGGPMSVAVFGVPRGGLEGLLAALGGPCRGLRGRLRLHVVLGAAGPPPRPPRPPKNPPGGCRGALERLAAQDPPSYTLGVPYPGNLLRNVAWEGAALPGGSPPKFGGRFVLLVDADVEPSPGLREGFLELLRGGGLHPKNWGRDPQNWGDRGDSGGPKTWELQDPKSLGFEGDLGAQGDFGDPKALGAPGGLTLGVPGGLNGLGDPKGHQDPGVPNVLGVPKALSDHRTPSDPKAPSDPKTLSDPKVLSDPKGVQDPSVPNVLSDHNAPSDPKVLSDPKTLSDPKGHQDPRVPKVLSDPNVLNDPNTLDVPNAPSDPKTLEVPNALSDPDAPSDPEAPWARVLFVLPAFEVRAGLRPPGSKAELLRLWGTGDARPFYGTLCPRCQAPTDFARWRSLAPLSPSLSPPRLRVAYEAPWRDPWEPFFVAPAHGVPPFDERFLQYGFNRISQACELHVAGFRFAVLDGAFVTHRGFKEPGGFHSAREAELGLNRRLFRGFRAELARRWPGSSRRC